MTRLSGDKERGDVMKGKRSEKEREREGDPGACLSSAKYSTLGM